jgi:anaerobic selenocysteine-containing dehydrogenase
VDTHLTASSRAADVFLPAATWAERRGTFTNHEDRITWLSHLVTAPRVAWPDWVIASELAARLGVDLGFSSLEEIWDEVARLSPLHQGVSFEALTGSEARDGVLLPKGRPGTRSPRSPRPLDPMADPGISSAELHNVAPTAMLHAVVSLVPEANGSPAPPAAELASTGGPSAPVVATAEPDDGQLAMPDMLGLPAVPHPGGPGAPAATGDPRTLRLVTRRTLWDAGTQVQAVPALAGLHPHPRLIVHPSVLAGMGVAEGEAVRVVSGRGALTLTASGDFAMPPGTVLLAWNLPGASAGELIDSSAPVTEVTLQPASEGGGSGG